MNTEQKPEALRLVQELQKAINHIKYGFEDDFDTDELKLAAMELERLHARVQELKGQLEAVRAGGGSTQRITHGAPAQTCTCPSGDGSLRWPCPAHPPSAAPVVLPEPKAPQPQADATTPQGLRECCEHLNAAGHAIPSACPHIIWYDDRDRAPEIFAGEGAKEAAERRFEQISDSWNAHLFVSIAANSRDCPHPVATVADPHPQAQADALDAERYRWLRDEWLGNEPEAINMERAKGQRGLDAAIDAAIAAAKEKNEQCKTHAGTLGS